jgi:hypothetical protein
MMNDEQEEVGSLTLYSLLPKDSSFILLTSAFVLGSLAPYSLLPYSLLLHLLNYELNAFFK